MKIEDRDSLTERVQAELEKWTKPLELTSLEKQGIISKVGAWYRVQKFDSLPEHVRARISEFTTDQKGLKVKFDKRKLSAKRTPRLQKD